MRAAASLVLAAALCAGAPAQADARGSLTEFAKRITVRMGVQQDSLAVLPVVLGENVEEAPGTLAAGGSATWSQQPGAEELCDVLASGSAGKADRVFPTGTILAGGDLERLLNRPVPLLGSSRVDLQACKLEYSIVSPK